MARWWWLVLAACGSDRVTVPATVVHADVACTISCPTYGDYGVCMPNADPITADTSEIGVVTGIDADKIIGIVEISYSGSVAAEGDTPYLTFILAAGDTAEVDASGDGKQLYRIDPQHGVIDLDRTRLAAASGSMLRFEYPGAVEQHVIDKPRPISVNVYSDDEPCCSTGRPSTAALLALVVLLLTRTSASRRCRRARPPRR